RKDWAAVHRALCSNNPLPELKPIFDPALVDNAAAGDIKGSAPDPALVSIENALPIVRSWPSTAAIVLGAPNVPEELQGTPSGPPGLDVSAPITHYLLYFSPREVQRIYEAATHSSGGHDQGLFNLAVATNFRSRLSPPLPDGFLGSPITLANVSLTGEQIASTLAPAASGIQRQSLVKSWQHLNAYGMDFGGGKPPRYVDAVTPSVDGWIQVMEAGPPGVMSEKTGSGSWYDEPVCLSVRLKADVMERLLKDLELQKYRDGSLW
ncbi:hypothetical protein C8Q74DRAFT_1228419, partial [Fomes fomentarius]